MLSWWKRFTQRRAQKRAAAQELLRQAQKSLAQALGEHDKAFRRLRNIAEEIEDERRIRRQRLTKEQARAAENERHRRAEIAALEEQLRNKRPR
ncbi:MAG: hypothetical protein Q8R13_02580 [bacterium]|nr:hypothetical protein [bacterium]